MSVGTDAVSRLRSSSPLAQALSSLDGLLLLAVLLLTAVGLTMVLSASGVMAEKFHGDSLLFFRKQCLFATLGSIAMFGLACLPSKHLFALKYPALVLSFLAILLTLVGPLSVNVNGASRWLSLGPVSMQPMEFAKIALVLYLAWFFAEKQTLVKSFSVGVIPPFAVTGAFCLLLLLQPDFGGAAVMGMLLFLMCLAGGTRLAYLSLSFGAAAFLGWQLIVMSPYRAKRLLAFMDPFEDALGAGYQLVQSLYALGSGGLWGQGLGAGKQKLFFLPEAHNDFIMAVVGEELGFVGVSLVFLLIGLLVWRAFAVAYRQEGLRERLLAFGLASTLTLGAVLNLAVVLGVAPPKGVPMPFVSYGGSNLLASFCCAGLLLNLSRSLNSGFAASQTTQAGSET